MFERLFNLDSKFMRFLFKAADILWLNVLTVVCMLPVFTIGPALCALSYSCLKIARDEDGNVTKMYFAAFKRKFGQSVLLGILSLVVCIVFVGDVYAIIIGAAVFPTLLKVASFIALFVVLITLLYVFPMQARFENKIPVTIKNAFWASLVKFPRTLLMLLSWLFLPACVLFITANFTPVLFLFGLSLPSYISAMVYDDFFKTIETRIKSANGENTTYEEENASDDIAEAESVTESGEAEINESEH